MRHLLPGLFLCVLPACAVAFSPGLGSAPPPAKFADPAMTPSTEERMVQAATATSMPALGMSFVVGGVAMDAGSLPKAPFPIVSVP